ncbi:MAG: hypothetical protein KKG93_00650 [Bacteroidetes bacterium]|nr:hypothetical protein [Bacteroidota bacterium]
MTKQNSNILQVSNVLPAKVIDLFFLVTLFVVFCTFWISSPLYSQSKIQEFNHISVEQGLSQGAVTSIVQDGYGFMWFGTRDGLNRYDGFTFTVSKQFASNSNPFSGQQISQLALGNENNLWIGTELNGISLLSLPTGRIETYKHNPSDSTSLSSNHITSVVEAKDGTVWVGTIDAGLNKGLKKGNGYSFQHYRNNSDKYSIGSDIIRYIYQDSQGRIWVCTSDGICLFDKGSDSFQQYHFNSEYGNKEATSVLQLRTGEIIVSIFEEGAFQLQIDSSDNSSLKKNKYSWVRITPKYAFDYANSMIEDNEGSVWISSTNNGLIQWIRSNNTFFHSVPFDPIDNSLFFPNIRSMFIDRTDVLWAGTNGGGIFNHDIAKNKFFHLRHQKGNPHSLFYSSVRGMYEDEEHKIWIGGYGALNLYDPDTKQIINHFFNSEKGTSNNIYCILGSIVNKNVLFLGTEGVGLRVFDKVNNTFDNSQLLPSQKSSDIAFNIYSMIIDRKNLLWLATHRGVFKSKYPVRNFVFGKPFPFIKLDMDPVVIAKGMGEIVNTIFEDHDGKIWIGTKFHGLAFLNSQSLKFEFVNPLKKDQSGIEVDDIKSILEDRHGDFWIGTNGAGIKRWKKADRLVLRNKYEIYTNEEGLPNNVVYGILEDEHHNIWISTNRGIVRITPENGSLRIFSKHDGLQGSEFNTASYLKSSDGKMYFGGVNGVSVFTPEQLTINTVPPQVVITGIKVHNNDLLLPQKPFATDTLQLEYRDNSFSFDFVALSYNSPQNNSYAYMMDGIDNDWLQAKYRRYANYTQVNPGVYTFRVKAANPDGVWNDDGAEMTVIIHPPFWLSWWFKTVIIFIVAFITPMLIIRRIRFLKKAQETQLKITRTIINRQEQDRMRIARELHDSLGQEIIVLKNRAHLAKELIQNPQKADEQLSTIEDIANRAISAIQSIVHDLRPIHLDRIGLTETLSILLKRIKESTGLQITWQIENIDNHLRKELEIIIFRCVQETFNNILKHSRATTATCEIAIENNTMKIFIWDNGIGTPFNLDTGSSTQDKISTLGFGIQNMIERVSFIGGSLIIRSAKGKGTNAIFEIPLSNNKG